MTAIENVLERLEGAKRSGDGWTAKCPAHEDRHASLSIGIGAEGRVLLRCHAGCDFQAIAAAVNVEARELFETETLTVAAQPDRARFAGDDATLRRLSSALLGNPAALVRLEELRGWTWPAIAHAGVGLDGDRVTLPYRSAAGDLVGAARYAPNPETRNGSPKLKADAGSRRELFPGPETYPVDDRWLFVVEGEPDALRVFSCGVPAVGVPGVNGWKREWRQRFAGRRVVVCFDCDKPGREAAQRVAGDLAGVAADVRVVELDRSREDGFDISDWLQPARTVSERQEAFQLLETIAEMAPIFHSARLTSSVRNGISVEGTVGLLPFAPITSALEHVDPDVAWVWEDYIAPGVLTLIGGRPKAGKSTLACGLLAAIEKGSPFLDRQTKASGILLLSEERSGTLREKVDRFGLGTRVHLLMSHQVGGKRWPDVVAEAVSHCLHARLGVLVVDTLHQWARLAGDSENSAGAVLEAIEPLQRAAAAGLAVVLIVHQRKSHGEFGEAVRGSNALTGGVDIVVEVERPRGAELLGSDGVRVLRAIGRFSSTPEELVIALTADGYEARGTTAVASAVAELDQLLGALEDVDGATAAELSEATGVPEATVRKRLRAPVDAGTVGKTGHGTKGDPFKFHSAQRTPLRAESNLTLLDGGAS